MNIKKVLTKQIKFGRIGYDNDFSVISNHSDFFTDSKSRKTCADPKKCRQDRYEYAAVRPVRAISRVSQQGLRDYSYPEADHEL